MAIQHHAVLIVSATNENKAEALGKLMGWGENNYTVRLNSTGTGNPTHYGLATIVSEGFTQLERGARSGKVPPGLVSSDVDVVKNITVDYDPPLPTTEVPEPVAKYRTPREHFDAVITGMALKEIAPNI